jgi:hypothetical protein
MPAVRAHGPAAITAAAATKYTVPAGLRFIMRHLHYQNVAGAVNFTASIGADAAGTRIYDAYPVASNGVIDHYPYYVLAAAEIFQAFASVAQGTLTIDGDLEAA